MEILGIIIFGAAVGFVADLIDRKHDNSLLANVVAGIVGALVGSFIRQLFTNNDQSAFSFDFWTFLWALLGTFLVLAAYRAIRGAANKRDRF